ncbi:MAG: phosphotransferase [Pseudonocardiales bacterium]|nr:phosphotransferase [Pseudonocardiales bacterium]
MGIDFGTLAVGDPACDLIAAWSFLDPAGRDVYREALGVDDATWARGRAWGMPLPAPSELNEKVRQQIEEMIADFRRD